VSGKHLQVCNILNIKAVPENYSENLDEGSGNMGICQMWGERTLKNWSGKKKKEKRNLTAVTKRS